MKAYAFFENDNFKEISVNYKYKQMFARQTVRVENINLKLN